MKWYKITLARGGNVVEKHEYVNIDENRAKTLFGKVCEYSDVLYWNYRRRVRLYEVERHTDGRNSVVQETILMKYDAE